MGLCSDRGSYSFVGSDNRFAVDGPNLEAVLMAKAGKAISALMNQRMLIGQRRLSDWLARGRENNCRKLLSMILYALDHLDYALGPVEAAGVGNVLVRSGCGEFTNACDQHRRDKTGQKLKFDARRARYWQRCR
jgi:hypothetical protein